MFTRFVLVTSILIATLALPAKAVTVGFRNPIADRPATVVRVSMIALQIGDAINSAAHARNSAWHEDNPQYKLFSHDGVVGYAVGFAAWDLAFHGIANAMHLGRRGSIAVDAIQAEGSLNGIIYTQLHSH